MKDFAGFFRSVLLFSALCYQLELQTNEIGLLRVHFGKVKPEVKLKCFRIIYSVGKHGSETQTDSKAMETSKACLRRRTFHTIQYNAMQCNAMQCNAMQCNAMQCNAMQCNAMQCNAMQCNAMQCNAMQCNAMQCNAMQCNAMQCNAMQCNAMQCKFYFVPQRGFSTQIYMD